MGRSRARASLLLFILAAFCKALADTNLDNDIHALRSLLDLQQADGSWTYASLSIPEFVHLTAQVRARGSDVACVQATACVTAAVLKFLETEAAAQKYRIFS